MHVEMSHEGGLHIGLGLVVVLQSRASLAAKVNVADARYALEAARKAQEQRGKQEAQQREFEKRDADIELLRNVVPSMQTACMKDAVRSLIKCARCRCRSLTCSFCSTPAVTTSSNKKARHE